MEKWNKFLAHEQELLERRMDPRYIAKRELGTTIKKIMNATYMNTYATGTRSIKAYSKGDAWEAAKELEVKQALKKQPYKKMVEDNNIKVIFKSTDEAFICSLK